MNDIISHLQSRDFYSLNFELDLCLYILKTYNPRISEILDATREDFFPGRFLIMRGKKKSRNIVIRDPAILEIVEFLLMDGRQKIFENLNYKLIYRETFRRYGHLISNVKYRKHRKVTHAFRYLNVANIKNESYIRDVLNHSRLSTQHYYINKTKDK